MGKYSPLEDYFAKQAADSITLSFDDIEEIINNNLPKSAYSSEVWWTKSSSPQSTAWSSAGYSVLISLEKNMAEFSRHKKTSDLLSYSNEIDEFQQRWNISKRNIEGNELSKFKNRLINLISPFIKQIDYHSVIYEFCLVAGIRNEYDDEDISLIIARSFKYNVEDSIIYKAFNQAKSKIEVIFLLQSLFLVLYNKKQYSLISKLYPKLKEVLDISPELGIQASNSNNKIILYPSGVKILDEKIINKDFQWLVDYPEVQELFEKSLTDYLKYTGANAEARSILDNLRASLEKLLKIVFDNDKPIEKNAKEIKQWLISKNVHPNIVNSVGVYTHLDNYIYFMNDVKHINTNVNYTKNEIEHMIYQTGIFIRLIIETEKNK